MPTTIPTRPQEWNAAVEKTYDARHDTSSSALVVDLDKCIKCGRCVTACNMMQVFGGDEPLLCSAALLQQ